jgi:hypothetical protein
VSNRRKRRNELVSIYCSSFSSQNISLEMIIAIYIGALREPIPIKRVAGNIRNNEKLKA